MSLSKVINKAYVTMKERDWDSVYWAIDLHGVCFKSNYEVCSYQWINQSVIDGLRAISSHPENKIILWSSVYESEMPGILGFFADNDIKVYGFNCNGRVANTETGCFDEKFYFSILLDDKAGFDPDADWYMIRQIMEHRQMVKEGFEILGWS